MSGADDTRHPWADPRTRWDVPHLGGATGEAGAQWSPRRRSPFVKVAAIAALVGLLAGFLTVTGARVVRHDRVRQAAPPATVAPALPSRPGPAPAATPDLLRAIGLQRVDVQGDVAVRLLRGGNRVAGQVTLDLCDATYATEANRTDRLQLVAVADKVTQIASTEAVLYDRPASTTEAFTELRAAARDCPASTARFNARPDRDWAPTPSVQRLAYDVVTTSGFGERHHLAVYLRRGRVLLGVYLPQDTGVDAPIAGHTAPVDIVRTFAERLAALPGAQIGG